MPRDKRRCWQNGFEAQVEQSEEDAEHADGFQQGAGGQRCEWHRRGRGERAWTSQSGCLTVPRPQNRTVPTKEHRERQGGLWGRGLGCGRTAHIWSYDPGPITRPQTHILAAAIIESVAKTAWKNGVNVQHANGGPGSCFGRNKGCAVQAQRRHLSMRYPVAPSRPCIRWTP